VDLMQTRLVGKTRNPWLMRLVLLNARFCLAAGNAGKDAETILGPQGQALKTFFEKSRLSWLTLKLLVKHSRYLIGVGGQYLVMTSDSAQGEAVKYNYILAGADITTIERTVTTYQEAQNAIERQFGELVQKTVYGMASLPLRWPCTKMMTLYARQEQLQSKVDLFSAKTHILVQDPKATALRGDITQLARQTRRWMADNKWLDLIGPENVVITHDSGEPRIRIIDTEPYVYEYLQDVNPHLGRSYHDIFLERLAVLDQLQEGLVNPGSSRP
jgi:hypothetical protein